MFHPSLPPSKPAAKALCCMPQFWPCVLAAWILLPLSVRGDFFVAANGSDDNPGTKTRPFATLERARDAVRTRKASQSALREKITIWLRGGDYFRTNSLELTVSDSGSPAAPIIWRAYKNERARLLGGRALTGFQPVTDAAVLARLDQQARAHIVQLDLRALGITDFGEMKSRGFGRSATAHGELFFANRPMTLARWPNEGRFEKIAGYPASSGQRDEHGGKVGELAGGFLYSGDRPRRWQDTSDLWVHGYWAYDWANSYEKVALLDPDQRLVKTAPPYGSYGFRKDQRFYFLNVLEELDQPGEWFLDRKSGVLYFWPPNAGVHASACSGDSKLKLELQRNYRKAGSGATETLFSTLGGPLLKLTDVSHVTFRGLVLEATRANTIEIRGGASNRILGCLIRNIGNSAVVIEGGTGHGVASCDIFDTGDGGVSLTGGNRQTLKPAGHFVENSHFQRQGRWSKCYVAAVHLNGVGNRASHNLIHDHPHCAILFWGNDHLMEFNEIHHIALETGDVGAIYTGRDYTFRGNRIRHNYIHETGGVGMGSMGVYMDDCVSGTEVFGNVFFKVHWAMFIGGGRDHRVVNNIFVDCDPAVRMDARGLDKSPVWHTMVDDTMRKRLAEVPSTLYRERYPELKSLDRYYGPPGGPAITGDAFKGVPPEGNVVAHNICVGKWLELAWHAKPEYVDVRDNLVDTDPKFVAADKQDFRLRRDSPAFKLGFQTIPIAKIGLRKDADRKHLVKLR